MEPANDAQSNQPAFQITKNRTGLSAPGGFAGSNLVASYLHIHFAGNPAAAQRFVEQCADYRNPARRKT
jgi:cobyrinic acid a,c-diamide synthase